MPTIEKVILELETLFAEIGANQTLADRLRPQNVLSEERYDARRRMYEERIRECRREMIAILQMYVLLPERHAVRHGHKLVEFNKHASYDTSVFVMTKFPSDKDGNKSAAELQSVIDTVSKGLEDRKYIPRIASDEIHHRWLWDNVELYLCGCARGIAIVEDKYLPELNPTSLWSGPG